MPAYDFRIPSDGKFGYLSASVDALATTMQSSAFAALPVLTTASVDDYIPVTLADDSVPAMETVWITGHADGSSAVTVVRGREGTTARAWTTGAVWRMAATARDLVLPVASRANLPTDAHLGARYGLIDEGVEVTKRPAGWTGFGKYGWKQAGGTCVSHPLNETIVSGMTPVAGQPSPAVPTMSAGVLKLNRPGFWSILYHVYQYVGGVSENNWVITRMRWPGGGWSHAVGEILQQKSAYIYTGGSGSNNDGNQTVSWTGWVTPAQAAAPITFIIIQSSSISATRTYDYCVDVEQLW